MSKQEKLFSRGVCVSDWGEITAKGLNVYNPTTLMDLPGNRRPWAPFYYHEYGTIDAETRAVFVAGEHNALPAVITIKVTPENFSLIRMRMAKVIPIRSIEYRYETPKSYDDLTGPEYTISLAGLDAEILRQLEARIGRLGVDGQFVYTGYEEFCREIRVGIEGRMREFRNI